MKSFLSAAFVAVVLAFAPINFVSATEHEVAVNINTADAEELDKYLDGIGKSKAQAIVDFRAENGAFESVDSLSDVKGIGSAIVEKNRDRITL
ncbi:ComEA family DNA-binding protein [Enterovibrio sp. ZSDZ35]|uniref:ComEA family DNA-binding protein n=1 Tax=Enterovibrio qingdaonensis TaxID=2899818 RepID=A0ABT5QN59_9GAMM|nr:ComEA family DNA-binding protein [Enterovibrio sp. ZSDZ35]MDD1782425.1 ComEA family DNA-binding protein [Enterovibrio sp. ZSDZ35]